jgi:hypothetical protein
MTWIVMIILAFVLLGSSTFGKFDLSGFDINNIFGGTESSDLVAVNKVLDFALTDQYGGSALASKTLLVYDSDGETQLESLTTGSDGTITTAFLYPSGKVIYVYYESSNDKQWWRITVPKMTSADVETATVNTITLKSFTIGTYTSDTLYHGATSIADDGSYNATASGDSPTFRYTLANSGSDNTGLMDSYDPLYKHNFWTCIYVTFSGTDYEKALVYGFQYDYTLGTTHYVASRLDSYALTREVDGITVKSEGTQTFVFSLDLSGLGASASITMQIYAYTYTDPEYSKTHGGAYGTEAVQIAEHAVTITDV